MKILLLSLLFLSSFAEAADEPRLPFKPEAHCTFGVTYTQKGSDSFDNQIVEKTLPLELIADDDYPTYYASTILDLNNATKLRVVTEVSTASRDSNNNSYYIAKSVTAFENAPEKTVLLRNEFLHQGSPVRNRGKRQPNEVGRLEYLSSQLPSNAILSYFLNHPEEEDYVMPNEEKLNSIFPDKTLMFVTYTCWLPKK